MAKLLGGPQTIGLLISICGVIFVQILGGGEAESQDADRGAGDFCHDKRMENKLNCHEMKAQQLRQP
jgi:hypothetical protein